MQIKSTKHSRGVMRGLFTYFTYLDVFYVEVVVQCAFHCTLYLNKES